MLLRFLKESHPGRGGRPDVYYARMAAVYVAHLDRPNPTAWLAHEHDPPLGMGESAIRNVLYEARRRGLLTAAPRGKAGGELTKKALDLLTEGN